MKMAGIYIHIPFCKSRCYYCDFHSGTSLSLIDRYLNALKMEIRLRSDYLNHEKINTIYFGGGTPSLLSAQQINDLVCYLNNTFDLSECKEITLECNPDDLSEFYISALKSTIVNRLSIGVQSFSDSELKCVNRRHTAQQAIDSINQCQRYGYNNIGIDLIFGLPRQTKTQMKQSLQQAVNLNVTHISVYGLTYEKGTRLWQQLQDKEIKPINEETSVKLFETTIETLTKNGFEHYEISNYARAGFQSLHNSAYWQQVPYIGLGSGAHSYNGISRQWNIADTMAYCYAMETEKPNFEKEILSPIDRYNEQIMLALRTAKGIDLNKLERNNAAFLLNHFKKESNRLIQEKKLINVEQRLKLTSKNLFLCDNIIRQLMYC